MSHRSPSTVSVWGRGLGGNRGWRGTPFRSQEWTWTLRDILDPGRRDNLGQGTGRGRYGRRKDEEYMLTRYSKTRSGRRKRQRRRSPREEFRNVSTEEDRKVQRRAYSEGVSPTDTSEQISSEGSATREWDDKGME